MPLTVYTIYAVVACSIGMMHRLKADLEPLKQLSGCGTRWDGKLC